MKFFRHGLLIICLSLLVPNSWAGVEDEDAVSFFTLGNEALDKGDFKTATVHYQEALSLIESFSLHYNLGFAYYRLNELGNAIFHFRFANRLNPRDADTKFNLDYARKSASDSVDGEVTFHWVELLNNYPLNLRESAWAFALVTLAIGIMGCFLVFWRKDWLVLTQRFLLIVWVFLLGGSGYRFFSDHDFGVVNSKKADAYSGKGVGSVLLFSLHEGTEFTIKDSQEDWLQIVLADGKSGWILAKDAISTKGLMNANVASRSSN